MGKKALSILLFILASARLLAGGPDNHIPVIPIEVSSSNPANTGLLALPVTVSADGKVLVDRSLLYFRRDSSTIEDSYQDNSDAVDQLLALLASLDVSRIDSVSVVAYSSPEGRTEYNLELSRKRAQDFSRLLSTRMENMVRFPVSVRSGGEAWDMFRERLAADTLISDTARERVYAVLDDPVLSLDGKKWRMKNGSLGSTEEDGDIYQYLMDRHFRYLRCMDISIYYREAPELTDVHQPQDSVFVDTVHQPSDETVPETEIEPEITPEPLIVPEEVQAVLPETEKPRRPLLGISTNLPYDIIYIPGYGLTSVPSFSIEYYPASGKFTFGADVEWPMWRHPQEHRYFQINNLTLWGRYYFKPEVERVKGLYLLANINAVQYGIGFNANQGWEGEGLGASLGVGYKLYLGKHVFLDAGAAFGYFYSWYDPYVWGNDATGRYYYDYYGNPEEFVPRNKRLQWFGPTRVYISLGIDLFNRKDRKRR